MLTNRVPDLDTPRMEATLNLSMSKNRAKPPPKGTVKMPPPPGGMPRMPLRSVVAHVANSNGSADEKAPFIIDKKKAVQQKPAPVSLQGRVKVPPPPGQKFAETVRPSVTTARATPYGSGIDPKGSAKAAPPPGSPPANTGHEPAQDSDDGLDLGDILLQQA
ncbi:hypothetical protein DIPPA_21862 [Diplonema papillatum]|nr:hypothetical protein DIPPA_21862 [Diplonema papillatum]